jgi:chemotaxis protein MotA
LELGSLIGIIAAFVFLIMNMYLSASGDIVALAAFINAPSVVLVFGGSFASTMISVPLDRFIKTMKANAIVFKPPTYDPAAAINKIVALANIARKEGVLALEDSASNMDDEFLKKGIMLIVDGTDPELVKGIMETELNYIDERHVEIASTFEFMGMVAPAWGMCGTLVGLILMLRNLSDSDALGPAMSMALITTLYGSVVANIWCNPFANKLKLFSKEEILLKTVLIEGMLSIQAGENPRIIEEKLQSFLAPALRGGVGAAAAAPAAAEEA